MLNCTVQYVEIQPPSPVPIPMPELVSMNLDAEQEEQVEVEEEKEEEEEAAAAVAARSGKMENNWRVKFTRNAELAAEALDHCIWNKVRIFLGFLQVYLAFYKTFDSPVMELQSYFASILSLADFDISGLLELFAVRCAWDHTHYDSLLLYTTFPVVFVVLIYCIYVAMVCIYSKCREAILKAKTEAMTMVLFLFFMVYPGVSRKIFESFICDEYSTADGVIVPRHVLSVDPRVNCDAQNRTTWLIYASVMVILYPVGIVVTYAVLLWSIRKIRHKAVCRRTPEEKHAVERVSFLHKPYTTEGYWFESYELLRKVVQTSVPVGLAMASTDPQSSSEMAMFMCQLLTFVAIIVLQKVSPYRRRTDYALAIISQFVLLNACVCALLDAFSRAGLTSEEFGTGTIGFSALVTASFVFLIFSFLFLCTFDVVVYLKNPQKFRRTTRKGVNQDDDCDDDDDEDNGEMEDGIDGKLEDEDDEDDEVENNNAGGRQGRRPLMITTTFDPENVDQQQRNDRSNYLVTIQ